MRRYSRITVPLRFSMGFHLFSLLNVQLILNRLFRCLMFIICLHVTYFSCGAARSIQLKCRHNHGAFSVLLMAGIKSPFANLLIHFFCEKSNDEKQRCSAPSRRSSRTGWPQHVWALELMGNLKQQSVA